MKTRNKKRTKFIFLYYAIIIIIVILCFSTYSKYSSTATSETKIDTAKFYFKIGNKEEQNIELNLLETLKSNIYSENEIVPGTKGTIELNLDFSNIEVATNYTISLDVENTKIPENLKLYRDSANTVEFNGYTGITELESSKITRNIYWKWNYTTIDETEEWMGKEIKLAFKIKAEQRTN